jgi:hydroxypyruvate isomerase
MTNRRNAIRMLAGATAAGTALHAMGKGILEPDFKHTNKLKGNINHSVCRWTYGHLSLDELCLAAKDIGIKAIDLVGPKDWSILKKHGLDSSMCNGAEISLTEGWNDTQYHATLIKNYTEHINLVSAAGYKNLICFSGNRKGMDDATGMKNCVEGLKKIIGLAEKKGVVIQMELFNSKVNHPDYMADKSAWGVALCKQLGSENFKLLYDIYHMQINEGDIIHTIEENHQYFGHYHTAGVPGRHEIDDNQELNYPAIMMAIAETGFKGYVAQEFIPTYSDKVAALRMAVNICDV